MFHHPFLSLFEINPMSLPHTLSKEKDILHIIGIGGIGMSALALAFHKKGFRVQGSDQIASPTTTRLKNEGIPCFTSHHPQHLENATVVLCSSAITDINEEKIAAQEKNLPILTRTHAFPLLIHDTKNIAVAGSHGKTTTSSILGVLLHALGYDPTIFTGGIMADFNSNMHPGEGPYVVIEADESDGTFLSINAEIAILTNLEPEHLCFYGSFEKMKAVFKGFLQKSPINILCLEDPFCQHYTQGKTNHQTIVTYGLENPEATLSASNIQTVGGGILFDLKLLPKDPTLKPLFFEENFLPLFGTHNVLNTMAALAVIRHICTPEKLTEEIHTALEKLAGFKGIKRRFNILSTTPSGGRLIDDYAHHPTEIVATLEAGRNITTNRLIAVVQPHRYTRLTDCFEAFCKSLQGINIVYLTPVYAAGESPQGFKTSQDLFEVIQAQGVDIRFVLDETSLQTELQQTLKQDDTLIFLGAGDISDWARRLSTTLPLPWENSFSS